MKGFWRVMMALVALAVLVGGALAWWGWTQWTGPGPGPGSDTDQASFTLVEIPSGMTLGAAADTLVARGLLKDRKILLAGARLSGQDRALRSGLYRLEHGASPRDLLTDLTSGRSVQVKVTIPEGLDAPLVAQRVSEALGFEAAAFLAAADSIARQQALDRAETRHLVARYDSLLAGPHAPGIRRFHWSEGYLAPDTYYFGAGTSPELAAEHLVAMQWARLDSLAKDGPWPNQMAGDPHALLTLASIVEAEARRADERRAIAAVYSNRLALRWRLEADPTVAFILEKKGKRLFYRDLEIDSPFNTYRQRGLPPGPIGSPGWAALKASAFPDTTVQALFFVSDGQGGHIFSRTSREHEEAVQRFRRLKAAERRQGGH